MIDIICKHCSEVFRDYASNKRVFCGRPCRDNRNGALPSCLDCGKLLDRRSVKRCFNCFSEKFLKQGNQNRKSGKSKCIQCGKILNHYRKNVSCSDCFVRPRGELSPIWQGGKTPELKRLRNSREYALWRTAVFMRDDYTCQSCEVRGGNLEANHKKPFALYPELRFAIDNGETLCVPCHRKTDTYGWKARWRYKL